jgi:hypothetical protein
MRKMDFQEELLSAFESIAKKYIDASSAATEFASVVVSTSDGRYGIKYNGAEYMVTDGINLNPSVGTAVWVRMPNGSISNAYICAKRG